MFIRVSAVHRPGLNCCDWKFRKYNNRPIILHYIIYYFIVDEEYWSSWCDSQLGCLHLTPDWSNLDSRLLNLEPWPRHRIMTKFSLHTRESPSLVVIIKPISYCIILLGNCILIYSYLKEPFDKWLYLVGNETKTITGTTFKASRPTKVLVHGFTNTGYEQIFQVLHLKNYRQSQNHNWKSIYIIGYSN